MNSSQALQQAKPNLTRLPKHLGIILDGNGRWAAKHNMPRSKGHQVGVEKLSELLKTVVILKIPVISLYAFSTENWKRPTSEIRSLWNLLQNYFQSRLIERCCQLSIQIRVSGDLSRLPSQSQRQLQEVMDRTAQNSDLIANFCINYGSQQEILRACHTLIQNRLSLFQQGKIKQAVAQPKVKEFERYLYTADLPPVDLIIRPGGELRLSNFLLWQSAYAEMYLTDTLWPDFTVQELITILNWFQRRERRFGAIKPM